MASAGKLDDRAAAPSSRVGIARDRRRASDDARSRCSTLAFVSGAPLFTIMLGAPCSARSACRACSTPSSTASSRASLTLGLGDQAEAMSTIPLFTFAGYLLAEAGTAERLVRFAKALLGWMPGGLAIVTIGTCALFTVFTGASGVTIVALGGVLLPALVRTRLSRAVLDRGSITGSGSVGLLFPPALPLFVYGIVFGLTGEPRVARGDLGHPSRFLFAGIVPGHGAGRHAVGGRGHGRDRARSCRARSSTSASSARASCSRCPSCASRSA